MVEAEVEPVSFVKRRYTTCSVSAYSGALTHLDGKGGTACSESACRHKTV